jgi:nicotinamidase-related amidase
MSSEPMRDPTTDHLLTPKNSALLIIDYQPLQVTSVASMDRQELVINITAVTRLAKLFQLPIVLSTVNVNAKNSEPTIHQLRELLPDMPEIDRTSINAWEDIEFRQAVTALGRKKLIMTALWTEACLSFPALEALKEGYEIYMPVDAVGGTSLKAHDAALRRIEQAGAKPISWVQMACELQRDCARSQTAGTFAEILFAVEGR